MKQNKVHISGKKVYWINGQSFENSSEKRDGRVKAINYCLQNFLDTNDIKEFDSRTERDRWEYLLELQKQGLISDLSHHRIFPLLPKFINANLDTMPQTTYECDFYYFENETQRHIIEDVKGTEFFIDDRFKLLKIVFDYTYLDKMFYIRVMLKRDGKWIEWHFGDKKPPKKKIIKQREEIKELREEQHKQEIAERKKEREIARLQVLRAKTKLTKQERLRLAELEERYSV